MSGYTPLFASITTGTLCGRWPDIWLWPIVLSLANRYGTVDLTPDYLARVTGLSVEEVTACVRRFCEPDPHSRSGAENGARLTLIESGRREWGWVVVNHVKYREKARLIGKARRELESGMNASRMRDRRRLPTTAADRLSESDSDNTKPKNKKRAFDAQGVPGLNLEVWDRWQQYRKDIGNPIKPPSLEAAAKRLAKLGDQQAEAVENSIANGYQGLIAPRAASNGGMTSAASTGNSEANARFDALVASEGADRTQRDHHALEAIGGFQTIRMRTSLTESQIRGNFVRAYHAAYQSNSTALTGPSPVSRKP